MFSTFSRVILPRAARFVQARGMGHIPSEPPKISGTIYMVGGFTLFIVTASLVQANGLITWGRSPDMDAALKK